MPRVTSKTVYLPLHEIDEGEEYVKGIKGKAPNKSFTYTINVDSNGVFSTTLPDEMVTFLKERGITDFKSNRIGNEGYFSAAKIDEVIQWVDAIVKKYSSYEVVERKVQIEYFIDIAVTYCKDKDGGLHPNGMGVDGYEWCRGNVDRDGSNNRGPFGFMFYARPVKYKRVRYCDGNEKVMREYRSEGSEDDEYMVFLSRVVSGASRFGYGTLNYIDYSEAVGRFFVNMYKSLFNLNEKTKEFLTPEGIKMMAEQQLKLLQ